MEESTRAGAIAPRPRTGRIRDLPLIILNPEAARVHSYRRLPEKSLLGLRSLVNLRACRPMPCNAFRKRRNPGNADARNVGTCGNVWNYPDVAEPLLPFSFRFSAVSSCPFPAFVPSFPFCTWRSLRWRMSGLTPSDPFC
eukprot:363620-Chlamydomonas_euryale.AAC.9